MAKGEDRMKAGTLFSWFISLVLLLALIFVLAKHRGGEEVGRYETAIREDEILSGMRLNLMKAAEAEKSAVMAITDEESREFADKARLAAAEVDKARKNLAALVQQDDLPLETARMAEFDRCWAEFLNLDRLVLDLAVQNTNIRAAKLAFTKGAEAVRRLEERLTGIIDLNSSENGNSRVVRLCYRALVAAVKIHDLYAPHIDAETDEEMDRLEKDIKANEEILTSSIKEIPRLIDGGRSDAFEDAIAACSELKELTKEIITLSRENTNIKSIRLSLGKKRLITAQCDEALEAFHEVIRGKGPKATR